MGTSTRLPGPRGGGWSGAKGRLSRWAPSTDSRPGWLTNADQRTAAQIASRFRQALRDALLAEPDRFGLRGTAREAGHRLVAALDELRRPDAPLLRDLSESPSVAPADEFVRRFVAEVGGDGTLIVDAVARRAARKVADSLVGPDGPLADPTTPSGITTELFCALYRTFFGELVGEFVHVLIAENVKLAVPVLVMLDPTDVVAGFVAEQVIKVLPDPCETAAAREPGRPRLAEVARELVAVTVDEALGLGDEMELAA
jgi:hypothetical protein